MEIWISNRDKMKTYHEHYKDSQDIYRKENGLFAYPRTKLYDFTIREYGPSKSDNLIEVDDKMMSVIGDISDVAKERFSDPETHCWFPPDVDIKNDIMLRMKNVWNINAMNELASLVMPQVEASLFGSYSIIDGLYFYRTIFKETDRRASLLWHYDNHVKERTKLLFYLNDVTEHGGPFEYMWNEKRNCGLKARTTRINHTHWRKHRSRIGEEEASSFAKNGFLPKKMLGEMGTFAMFDNNIVHRANIPSPGTYRDAFVLMYRPYHEKLHSYIDERWTGTNYHVDTNPDPEDIKVVKK
jgi:hypothetical protein